MVNFTLNRCRITIPKQMLKLLLYLIGPLIECSSMESFSASVLWQHVKKSLKGMESFWPKNCVTGGTKIRPKIQSYWRIFESNWLEIESQFNSNILQLLGIPGRILVPKVTQLFRSKWLYFFLQWSFRAKSKRIGKCLYFNCLYSQSNILDIIEFVTLNNHFYSIIFLYLQSYSNYGDNRLLQIIYLLAYLAEDIFAFHLKNYKRVCHFKRLLFSAVTLHIFFVRMRLFSWLWRRLMF